MPRLPCLSLLFLLVATAVSAEDRVAPNADPMGVTNPSPAGRLLLAHLLYAQGLADQDGLTVMAAARMSASVPQEVGPDLEKVTDGEAMQGAEGASGPVTPSEMLETARKLAEGDDTALTLIERAETTGSEGRNDIAVVRNSVLEPGQTDHWKLPLFGGAYAELGIVGDGDSNLDLSVADEGGQILCQERSPSDTSLCAFVPAQNGYFTVIVQNHGPGRNSYLLVTN